MSNNWGFYLLLTELPAYMKNILHYDTQSVNMNRTINFQSAPINN